MYQEWKYLENQNNKSVLCCGLLNDEGRGIVGSILVSEDVFYKLKEGVSSEGLWCTHDIPQL